MELANSIAHGILSSKSSDRTKSLTTQEIDKLADRVTLIGSEAVNQIVEELLRQESPRREYRRPHARKAVESDEWEITSDAENIYVKPIMTGNDNDSNKIYIRTYDLPFRAIESVSMDDDGMTVIIFDKTMTGKKDLEFNLDSDTHDTLVELVEEKVNQPCKDPLPASKELLEQRALRVPTESRSHES